MATAEPFVTRGREEPLSVNDGKPWSEMDLFDLKNSLAQGTLVEEIADFLCRSEQEVCQKIAELERSRS